MHALFDRAKSLERQDIVALIESKRDIDREHANKIVDEIMAARERMIAKAQKMKDDIEKRLEQARRDAMHQADEMRKTAAVAAWWIFASSVVSGLAAALGAWVAVLT